MANAPLTTAEEILTSLFGDQIELDIRQEKEIASCLQCKGVGFTYHSEISDYHKREYDTVSKPCKTCGSEGRVTRTTMTVRLHPRYPYSSGEPIKVVAEVPYSSEPIDPGSVPYFSDTRRFKF